MPVLDRGWTEEEGQRPKGFLGMRWGWGRSRSRAEGQGRAGQLALDPIQDRGQAWAEAQTQDRDLRRGLPESRMKLFDTCANPGCDTGWMSLFRSRSVPVFEGGWTCSEACARACIEAALCREMEGRVNAADGHRHRIPLGLVMLEQGWISSNQLRLALEAQKGAGAGKLGHWLRRQQVSENLITRALGLQWSCPVLSLELHDAAALTAMVPRLFVDAFGALPLRVAAGRLLYLGFEDRLDPVVALAIERMSGLQVESGLVRESLFRAAQTQMLNSTFPAAELIEATAEPELARVLAHSIEKARPVESRLVRVHDCLWLRMWLRPQNGALPQNAGVQDLIGAIGAH